MWALLFTFFSFFPLFCCLGRSFLAVSRSPQSFSSFGNSRPAQHNVLYLKLSLKLRTKLQAKQNIFFFSSLCGQPQALPGSSKASFFLQVHWGKAVCRSTRACVEGLALCPAERCVFTTGMRAGKDRHTTSRGRDK